MLIIPPSEIISGRGCSAHVHVDENNWIGGLEFVRCGDSIRAEIRQMDGTHGFIRALRVEVVSVELLEKEVVKPEA